VDEATRQTGGMPATRFPAAAPGIAQVQAGWQQRRYHSVRRSLFFRAVAAVALIAPGIGVLLPIAAPAVHADLTVTLDGHGNGHGYGLSQWGAYGYAVDHSWSAQQILDHYYGGTVSGTVPTNTVIAVRLMNLDGAQTAVVSATGGLVVDGVAGGPWKSVVAREVSPSVYSVWARTDAQVCPSAADTLATGWTKIAATVSTQVNIRTQVDSSTTTDFANLAAVCEPGGNVRSYRGLIRAINDTAGANRTVNEVPLEHYLRSVIAKEMSPSWATAGGGKGAQALQAQAVAARSFALADNRYSYATTCDLICQTYLGAAVRTSVAATYTRIEYPATDAAVAANAGVVRRVGTASGPVALTMFAASSGGWTAAGPGGLVPFPAVVDEGDSTAGNPAYNWSVSLTGSAISAKYPAIGTFISITFLTRNGLGDMGGRVLTMRLNGSAGTATITGDAFRSAFGLKSNWFTVRGTVVQDPCDGRNPPPVGAGTSPAAGASYTSLAPVRIIDTRSGLGTAALPLGAGCTMVVDPALDPSVTAVAVNLTSIRPTVNGYVTAYPCGVTRPVVSAIQAINGRAVAGTAVVPLGADGTFCVFSSVASNLAIDLFGTYAPAVGVKFEPTAPTRLYDSRSLANPLPAGSIVHVPVIRTGGAPAGATAAALTLHAMNATGTGYATVYPCTAQVPVVSSINTVSGSSVTNHVDATVSATGEVCIYLSVAMHVAVDFSGWFGPTGTTQFFAVAPFRAIDTRNAIGLSGMFAANVDRPFTLAGVNGLPAAAVLRAVLAETTAVAPTGSGYLTVHPCMVPLPNLSMVRYAAGANAATTVAGPDDETGRWCITASSKVHVLVDVSGYFA